MIVAMKRVVAIWYWDPRNWGWVWPVNTTGVYAEVFYREAQFGPLELRWRTKAR